MYLGQLTLLLVPRTLRYISAVTTHSIHSGLKAFSSSYISSTLSPFQSVLLQLHNNQNKMAIRSNATIRMPADDLLWSFWRPDLISPNSVRQEVSSHIQSDIQLSTLLPALIILALVYYFVKMVWLDYKYFLSLGPGGVSSSPAGYLKLCGLRIIAMDKKRTLCAPENQLKTSITSYFKGIRQLPHRRNIRPIVVGVVPQRQLNQRGSREEIKEFQARLAGLALSNPGQLRIGQSCIEKHSVGLFLSPLAPGICFHRDRATNAYKISERATKGMPPEILHTHDIDGSLHLTLHPTDLALVIKQGWGERHPLAGKTCPVGFTLIYAPRDEEDFTVVLEIVKAAAWWVGEVQTV